MDVLGKIKSIFSMPDAQTAEFDRVVTESRDEYARDKRYFWDVKISEIRVYKEEVAKWPDDKRVGFIVYCVKNVDAFRKGRRNWSSDDPEVQRCYIQTGYINHLLRAKIHLSNTDVRLLYKTFAENLKWETSDILSWPLTSLLTQIERQYKDREREMSDVVVDTLQQMKTDISEIKKAYYEKDKLKLIEKIDGMLFRARGEAGLVKPTRFLGEDAFAAYANAAIERQPEAEKAFWYRLLALAQKASGGKPSKKYLDDTKAIFRELGAEKFKRVVNDWFLFLTQQKEILTSQTEVYSRQEYAYTSYVFISSVNTDAVKGFVWMCAHFHDNITLRNLAGLAERCYRKIAGRGPAAAAIANACFYVLYKSKGLDGIGQLSRLRLRIKQNTAQSLIERYLNDAAAEQGVSLHEIEDLAADDFDLADGKREMLLDGYKAEIRVTGPGKSELNWYKPDGSPQKSTPAFVKDKYTAKLLKIKDLQKQIDQTTIAQRDRIDRMLRADRKWAMEHFKSLYLDHGLMGFLAKKIIWNFDAGGRMQAAIYLDGQWVDNDSKLVQTIPGSTVSLWHPAMATVAGIKKWRDFLVAHKIQQPLKQAFRELYLLTDAEINTKRYSNRMAAHVLKQHQFNNLAKMRGWKYSLLGAYDDGRFNTAAELKLPEYGLKAEYWVNEVNVDGAWNDASIWNYIATDQIRFVNTDTNTPVDLVDVPAIPFSEVLRDVDLFVGVASVGNDPAWRDSGGVPAYRDYWTAYSFGDLSEVAKSRREILVNLVPRLKIGKVAEVKDRFLVVKGKLRTYRIHIGSTNILMEPNDQYLCIVPDRSQKSVYDNLFLPFEGDTGLSIILSKAFLLAEDDKITDGTITSQINRR